MLGSGINSLWLKLGVRSWLGGTNEWKSMQSLDKNSLCVCVCVLLKNLISLHPLQCGTLITYAAVCHLIVAIVMLIRAPHAEKRRGTNLSCLFCLFSPHQESAAICTFSPASLPPSHPLSLSAFTSSSPLSLLHLLHPSFCVSVLYVFYNCSNNQLIWKTLNYQATSNLPTVCPAPPNQCMGGGGGIHSFVCHI